MHCHSPLVPIPIPLGRSSSFPNLVILSVQVIPIPQPVAAVVSRQAVPVPLGGFYVQYRRMLAPSR